jgi:hypothetical protein
MIFFRNGRPEQIHFIANTESQDAINLFGNTEQGNLGTFILNPYLNTLTYSLPQAMIAEDNAIRLHGFAPKGWSTDPIIELPNNQSTGIWNYPEDEEKNILAGLAYLRITSKTNNTNSFRAQIEPVRKIAEDVFEDHVTINALAGSCNSSVSIFGIAENLPMDMEPAQVIMARTEARLSSDGFRGQDIGCAIRVGGANIPGIGKIEIGMFGSQNPGHIVAMQRDSDFPAKMTLDVRKHYITPMGTFYSDREEFYVENIQQFPPFGMKFTAVNNKVPLREEKTSEIVGEITLNWLIPLCFLNPSSFPPKALPNFKEL